ncbi:substrate-binding domain-containing protein [Novosphingobium resinovorum]
MAAGRLLLEISPRPTAILACNDEMAAGVLHAAAQDDVPVPQALSVVGFDDTSSPTASSRRSPRSTCRGTASAKRPRSGYWQKVPPRSNLSNRT